MIERKNAVTMRGNPLTLVGPELKAGERAPEFTALDNGLQPVRLSDSAGKVRLITSLPSLDTGVCDAETRRFNQEAAAIPGVQFLAVSMDLPFAQKRFCSSAGIDRVQLLSDHRDAAFGSAYGTLIKENRLLSRAVFVVDGQGQLRHVEYVPEIGQHPDYDRALAALRAAG
jgi:thiol peroxidase